MRRKGLVLLLSAGLLLTLASCTDSQDPEIVDPDDNKEGDNNNDDNNENENENTDEEEGPKKDSVELIYNLLTGDAYEEEVLYSNFVNLEQVYETSNYKDTTSEETYLEGSSTYYYGSTKREYTSKPEDNYEDSYIRKSQATFFDPDNSSSDFVFFDVVDYKNDNSKDRADILPIVGDDEGDPALDGTEYLMESTVVEQLSKQSTLYISQFISTYLLNNVNLGGQIPAVYIDDTDASKVTYYLHDFSYSYEEDGTLVEFNISFDATLEKETNRLVSAETSFRQTETRGENDTYFVSDTNKYEITYGERNLDISDKEELNVRDYYLLSANGVRAYTLDGGEKTYYELNNIPVNEYIRFEAVDYLPAKSVDIQLYPTSANDDWVDLDLNNANVSSTRTGRSIVTIQSQLGTVIKNVEVTFVQPEIRSFNVRIDDSIVESDYTDDYEDVIYSVYNNTVYSRFTVTIDPVNFSTSDFDIVIEHPDLISLRQTEVTTRAVTYEMTVGANEDNVENTTITFVSKSNPNIKEVVDLRIKRKLSIEEIQAELLKNSYRFDFLYQENTYFYLDFVDGSTGVYREGGDINSTSNFTYTLNDDYTLSINFESATHYEYDETARVRFDGKAVTLEDLGDTMRTCHFIAEE